MYLMGVCTKRKKQSPKLRGSEMNEQIIVPTESAGHLVNVLKNRLSVVEASNEALYTQIEHQVLVISRLEKQRDELLEEKRVWYMKGYEQAQRDRDELEDCAKNPDNYQHPVVVSEPIGVPAIKRRRGNI
jgi:hypothetical protein